MKKLLFFLVPTLFLALVCLIFFWTPKNQQYNLSSTIKSSQNQMIGGEFTLQSVYGKVSLDDFRDKLVLIYFGYTWCPDICPTSLSLLAGALSQLDQNEISRVQGIFISVDPDRDTVKHLSNYTAFFHPTILGLTGTKQQLDDLTKRYGASYRMVKQDSATDYVVDHSSVTYIVGKNGKLIETLPHATPVEKILASIRKHL
jgi:protein SCO1/2